MVIPTSSLLWFICRRKLRRRRLHLPRRMRIRIRRSWQPWKPNQMTWVASVMLLRSLRGWSIRTLLMMFHKVWWSDKNLPHAFFSIINTHLMFDSCRILYFQYTLIKQGWRKAKMLSPQTEFWLQWLHCVYVLKH